MARLAVVSKEREFDPNIFLATIGDGRKLVVVPKKQSIYTQPAAKVSAHETHN